MLPTTIPSTEPLGRISAPGEPAWEVALLFPHQGEWSETEYLALDSSRLVELSNGFLEVLPMPTIYHQLLAIYLHKLLDAFVAAHSSGMVLLAPLPVHLWEGKYREPDVVYFRRERVANVHGQPEGADLVMEVVSEGAENRDRDLRIKREEYARAGIAEYWIVDPAEQRITVLTLEGQTYREHGVFASGSEASSILLPGFQINVQAVFAAGEATR